MQSLASIEISNWWENISKDFMQFKCNAHLYITLLLRTQYQTAQETLQSQNSLCKNSSALIQKTQLCWCVCPHAFFRAVSAETANLMVTLTFCLQRTWALRKKWAKAITSMAQLLLLFTFFVTTFFFPVDSGWEADGLASSTPLLAVHYF